jgi:hypothetical protein
MNEQRLHEVLERFGRTPEDRGRIEANAAACDRWNAAHPAGTPVRARRDDGSTTETRTRGKAFLCHSGEAVIFVEQIRGFYLLERISTLEPPEDAS